MGEVTQIEPTADVVMRAAKRAHYEAADHVENIAITYNDAWQELAALKKNYEESCQVVADSLRKSGDDFLANMLAEATALKEARAALQAIADKRRINLEPAPQTAELDKLEAELTDVVKRAAQ